MAFNYSLCGRERKQQHLRNCLSDSGTSPYCSYSSRCTFHCTLSTSRQTGWCSNFVSLLASKCSPLSHCTMLSQHGHYCNIDVSALRYIRPFQITIKFHNIEHTWRTAGKYRMWRKSGCFGTTKRYIMAFNCSLCGRERKKQLLRNSKYSYLYKPNFAHNHCTTRVNYFPPGIKVDFLLHRFWIMFYSFLRTNRCYFALHICKFICRRVYLSFDLPRPIISYL
jgi:hypothetical protein